MSNDKKLTFLALGGAGEIGMNMYLYGYGAPGNQRFLLVDAGVTFPEAETTPGVDLIMADPAFIAERADRLEAIVITHAHEDHIGALGHLYPQLKAPIVCRRFTAHIARQKMERAGQDPKRVKEIGPWPETRTYGPFTVGLAPVSHSIPEASAVVIDTPGGRVVHTGDFKLDPTPLLGEPWNPEQFRAIGEAGVSALVCDSTNVFSLHPGRSEAHIVPDVEALMAEATGLVVATTFASNIARLRTLAQAAHDHGRSVVVLGRAMAQMIQNGFETGTLPDFPPTIDVRAAEKVPRDHLFMLATGSQGEPRAATAQLSGQSYMGFRLKPGDTFLFSSKTIPGNEVSVARILNRMSEQGVRVIDDDQRYHVSGHANRPDLEAVHALLNPGVVIPMHGEHRHLAAHAELARTNGRHALVAPNGTMVEIAGRESRLIDEVGAGRIYLDGTQLIGALDGVVRERVRIANRGHVVVSVMLEPDGSPSDTPWVEAVGLPPSGRGGRDLAEALEAEVDQALGRAARGALKDDEQVQKIVERAIRTEAESLVGKKPVVTVLINRFE